ncbi:MAG: hypothetical protein FWG72_06885 [Oscillospiraceae bacterium]|nr:hypothetical protein [Oscillospiraceae bacterium]
MKKYEAMAKLDLPEDERRWIAGLAEKLLEGFAVLNDINLPQAGDAAPPVPPTDALRDDVAVKAFARDDILAAAPERYDGYFQIPKTVV